MRSVLGAEPGTIHEMKACRPRIASWRAHDQWNALAAHFFDEGFECRDVPVSLEWVAFFGVARFGN